VAWVWEDGRGSSDAAILERAQSENRLVATAGYRSLVLHRVDLQPLERIQRQLGRQLGPLKVL